MLAILDVMSVKHTRTLKFITPVNFPNRRYSLRNYDRFFNQSSKIKKIQCQKKKSFKY